MLAEEVAKELLEDAPLPVILPVILAVLTLHNVQLESSFLAHVTMVRQKSEIKIMSLVSQEITNYSRNYMKTQE